MPVAQPTHLLIFNEASGTTVTNAGTHGTNYVIQQGTSPTHYEWVQQAQTPTGGYLDSKVNSGSNMPYMTVGGAAQSSTIATINCALGFWLDAIASPRTDLVTDGSHGLRVRAAPPAGSGNFDLQVRVATTSDFLVTQTYSALSFGTFYQLALSVDVTTIAAAQMRIKLGAGSVQTPATGNFSGGQSYTTPQPLLGAENGFTDATGVDGRYYYFAYQRGGTAWASADLDDINADPSASITGWPGGGPPPPSTTGRGLLLGVG
jgi:hypothetical protein